MSTPLYQKSPTIKQMITNTQSDAGSINERGFLNGLYRKGFTHSKCISELIANSLDSMDKMDKWGSELNKKIGFEVFDKFIRIIDNGYGMDRRSAIDMFDMHRENHEKDMSRGVSGIGAKPALVILSEKKTVQLLTRVPDGAYLCITVPWDIIYSKGKYNGMIKVANMTDAEKSEFEKERQENQMTSISGIHGTTIKFPFNYKLVQAIENNFPQVNEESEDINPLDRIGIIFGRDNFNCFYKHHKKIGHISMLPKYNYLNGLDYEYYLGKSEDIIELWKNLEDEYRFLWRDSDGKKYEIRTVGRGFGKVPEPCTLSTNGWKHVSEFKVIVGLRKNPSFFDDNNPQNLQSYSTDKNTTTINPYHTEHLGKDIINFLSCFKLVRNNQLIGIIPPPDIKISSHRANVGAFTDIVMIQCEVSYTPVSTQDCPEDHAMNIQENKNQYDGSSVDKRFTRLVAAIKKKKFTEIWNYFQKSLEQHHAPPVPEIPEPEIITLVNSILDKSIPQDSGPIWNYVQRRVEQSVAPPVPEVLEPQNITPTNSTPDNSIPQDSGSENTGPEYSTNEDSAPEESAPEPQYETPQPEVPQPESPQPESPQPEVPKPEAPQLEAPQLEAPQPVIPNNKIPSDIRSHRRGLVYSDEIIQQLERVSLLIGEKEEYTDSETISLYNTLMYYNP